MNATQHHPIERLRVSNIGYSPKHVNNIAQHLANVHSVQLPYGFPQTMTQNAVADWIVTKFGYDKELICRADEIVRANYVGKQKIYRKGRPIGSKNKNKYLQPSRLRSKAEVEPSDLDPFADSQETAELLEAGLATLTTPAPVSLTTEQPTPSSVDATAIARTMLSAYVLKRELEPQINRIGLEVNNHNEAIKAYVTNEFAAINAKVASIELAKPTIVTLERKDLPSIELGVQHRHFSELLAMCNASLRGNSRLNVWVYGPAGTGKTTAAKFVAKALALPFYTLGALETGFQVLGYNDAHGNYSTTLFRQCWEHGGVIALDEIDSYSTSAALALNGALANGHCAFPDRLVERHPNCIIIAGANTTGLGGTIEYVGRMKQDAAFLDRFVMLDWPIDEALEDALCANKSWLAIVRHCRAAVISKQIKGAMITPRATLYGESLIDAGLKLERVLAATVKKGMSEAQWAMIQPNKDLLAQCFYDTIPVVKVEQITEAVQ